MMMNPPAARGLVWPVVRFDFVGTCQGSVSSSRFPSWARLTGLIHSRQAGSAFRLTSSVLERLGWLGGQNMRPQFDITWEDAAHCSDRHV